MNIINTNHLENVDLHLTACPQNAMPVIDPPVECADPANTSKREWYLEQIKTSDVDNFDYSERFFDTTEDLWKDKGVLECFARSNEYQERLFAQANKLIHVLAELLRRANFHETGRYNESKFHCS